MGKNKNLNIVKILMRITGGLLIFIISTYLGSLINTILKIDSDFTILAFIFIITVFYIIAFEKQIRKIEDDFEPNRLTLSEQLFEYKDKILSIIVIIIGILGFSLAFSHKLIEIHYFIGIFLLSTIVGSQIRKSFHKVSIGFLTNDNIYSHLSILIFLLSLTIIIIVSIVQYNELLIISFLAGIPIGITAISLQILLNKRDFRAKFIASQDYFLIQNIMEINPMHILFKPAKLYLNGNLNSCLRKLKRIKKQNLSDQQLNKILELEFRCLLRLEKFQIAENKLVELETIKNSDHQIEYLNAIIPFYKKDLSTAKSKFLDIIKKYEVHEPIIYINFSYLLNKERNYAESMRISSDLISLRTEINPIIKIFSINNFCYSSTRSLLEETKYFRFLDNRLNNKYVFSYNKEQQYKLINSFNILHVAYNLNSKLGNNPDFKHFDTHRQRQFVLDETKSILNFALGNFDEAISIINKNLKEGYNKSSTYKWLAIYNAILGNKHSARLNFIEYKAHEKGRLEDNFDNYKSEIQLITKLLAKSGKKIDIELSPNFITIEN